jgi:hypothetical protein
LRRVTFRIDHRSFRERALLVGNGVQSSRRCGYRQSEGLALSRGRQRNASVLHCMLRDQGTPRSMNRSAAVTYLQPPAFVRQVMTMGRSGFNLLYPDMRFLVVRLLPDTPELAEGFSEITETAPAFDRAPSSLEFHTDKTTEVTGLFRTQRESPHLGEAGPKAWATMLAEGPHFVVPIRKRSGADGVSADRISVGRARNKDVVLRHASVSKFHGWFQINEAGDLCFMDVGSKNGTRLNERPLDNRQLVQLATGDKLQIGRIDGFICDADSIWSALHPTAARASRLR